MHFTNIAASAALVSTVLAGEYYPTTTKVYTSVSTCTKGAEGKPTTSAYYYTTSAAAYYVKATTSSAAAPYKTPVTYTSYEHITVTSCADYVVSCPAKTYTSAHYSTCTEELAYAHPTTTPAGYYVSTTSSAVPYYYAPPSNGSYVAPSYVAPSYVATTTPCTTTPVVYATPSSSVQYTTVYTTVCPGANYCYGTTITTTYCPTSTAVSPPVYTSVVPASPTYVAPPPAVNSTTPYTPPIATGAASSVQASFGLGAFALIAAFLAL